MSAIEATRSAAYVALLASVRFRCTRTDRNPAMDPDGRNMDHWRCTLMRGGHRMQLTFSKGFGHHGAEPTVGEVLSCLALDASLPDDFAEFCAELGYDEDSRTAERSHRQLVRQSDRTRVLFTDEDLDLIREEDR